MSAEGAVSAGGASSMGKQCPLEGQAVSAGGASGVRWGGGKRCPLEGQAVSN